MGECRKYFCCSMPGRKVYCYFKALLDVWGRYVRHSVAKVMIAIWGNKCWSHRDFVALVVSGGSVRVSRKYWRAGGKPSVQNEVVLRKGKCLANFPSLCWPERWSRLNRISHPDWVKLYVDANGRIRLRAKQKCEFLAVTTLNLADINEWGQKNSNYAKCLVKSQTSMWTWLQCRRLSSFA